MKDISLFLLVLSLAGCIGADIGYVSRRASQVQIGFTREQVVDIMGTPDTAFTNPSNKDITYSHYCIFGVMNDDANGFFFYKDKVFRKRAGDTLYTQNGLYRDESDLGWNCHSALRLNWAKTPEPPQTISERQAALEAQRARKAQIVSQDYLIDGLVIVHTQDTGAECASGGDYKISVRGDIGPDSSFALEELLRRSPNCLQENREIKSRTTIELESLGGFLNDGYLMGRTFRKHEIKTIITKNTACASSCAVAYLGGTERLMEND